MPVITGKTKLLGVIGHPIEHSLSPVMHNAAMGNLGMDYIYIPLAVEPENLKLALEGFAAIGLKGFNVTIPYKESIIPLLSEISPIAKAVGAVNTVWRTENGWSGTNTDVAGFLSPLQYSRINWSQSLAIVLGNGGGARAVVAGLTQLGCSEIHIIGRNQNHLEAFQKSWENSRLPLNLSIHSYAELPKLISKASIIVNTTPIGMYPYVDDCPIDIEVMEKIREGTIAYDLIYTPNPTKFLNIARSRGAIGIDGLEMLVQQGAAALKIWLQQPVPVDVMRNALRYHLGLPVW